jgi:hypothetical protein
VATKIPNGHKMHHHDHKNTKWPKNTPIWPQKYQMAIKYTKMATKVPNCSEKIKNFPSQGLPKCVRVGIFGMKI